MIQPGPSRSACHFPWPQRIVIACLTALWLVSIRPLPATEIDFVERFALADDRAAALEQLIPGTKDYYFYRCLHAQQMQKFDEAERLLADWIKRHGETPRVKQLQARQMLLRYEDHAQKTLDYLRRELGLHFHHQPDRSGDDPRLPTALDPQIISRDALFRGALRRHKNTDGFTPQAFEWLIGEQLTPLQRRHLLERLDRPDYQGLVPLVIADLKQQDSRGFGSLKIHELLLHDQLDKCVRLDPNLRNQQQFVSTYLSKLAPSNDVDWKYDRDEAHAYLERLWKFVSQLDAPHNSLKAQVLYRQLMLDRAEGTYRKTRFLDYLKLPRHAAYVSPRFMEQPLSRRFAVDLDYRSPSTLLPPIGDDEPLVRSYLQHFFFQETNYNAYEPYVDDQYLKRLFAETKIVEGIGDAAQWYAMLEPSEVQALKNRIDLEFAPTNPSVFQVDDELQLDLYVKNVKKLIVKVFRINTENYYREQKREINTDIQLDGLVANEELSFTYDVPAERRILRSYSFPQLKDRGVYVIDFIGNGISSRAVVRKGALRCLVRTGSAGPVFTVLNESNQRLPDAKIWMDGQEFYAAEDGTITIPFSTKAGQRRLVVSHQEFAALHSFHHHDESYELRAAFYVDREALVKHRQAEILVRPRLLVSGHPLGLGSLQNVRLRLTSVDLDGTATTKEIAAFQLHEDRESTTTIQVPARLDTLRMELQADIEQLSTGKTVQLSACEEITLNQIDKTARTEDIHFLKSGERYLLEVLGRSGELRAKRPLQIELKHRDFRGTVTATLQSDDSGQIGLGPLHEIVWIKATGSDGHTKQWTLASDAVAHARNLHGVAGQPLRIPYAFGRPTPTDISLLELRYGTPVADAFQKVAWQAGSLQLNDLQPGNYRLILKRSGTRIDIRVTAGTTDHRHALGSTRLLEIRQADPLRIAEATIQPDALRIQLEGATKYTRLHVFATRYQPAFSPFDALGRIRDVEPATYRMPTNIAQYSGARNLGDEYRYVLDRKYAERLPGNMLQRPSLLLNPWAIRDTETGQQVAAEGTAFEPSTPPQSAEVERETAEKEIAGPGGDSSNLDFLAHASAVLVNLKPDKDGLVTVDRNELAPHQHLHFVAVDPVSTVYQQLSVPAESLEAKDLRLILALAPDKHYAPRKRVAVLNAGESFTVADVTTARFQYYDSLQRLYQLYATLSGEALLANFQFITAWPQLTKEQQRQKYSEFACHELHYFLMKKDPAFFEDAVLPFLANKKDKTFMDHWLLGESLKDYFSPWQYERLNIVERILLGQRVDYERQAMRRHVRELLELVPRDVDRQNRLFATALGGRALGGDDDWQAGLRQQMEATLSRRKSRASGRLPSFRGARAGSGRQDLSGLPESDRRDGPANGQLPREAETLGVNLDFEDLYDKDEASRQRYRQLYVQLEKTKEWVENNYYQLPLESHDAERVTVNAFWNDFAESDPRGETPFFSRHWAKASHNFTEIMLALATIDLPFEAEQHKHELEDARLTLTAASPMVIFHEQIQEVDAVSSDAGAILVSQHFYRQDDRYEVRGGLTREKFITDEFLVNTVYGCQAVITNPTSTHLEASVLLQIPVGAVPVAGSHYTRSLTVDLAPYSSQALEYHFYFPVSGSYEHFPVHVSDDESILGFAAPVTLKVVDRLSQLDTDSWAYVSQFATSQQVLEFLRGHNVHELNLDRIAFRMQDKDFFEEVTDLLRARHAYHHVLWSYAIRHQQVDAINEFLLHDKPFISRLGPSIESPLVTVEPVQRRTYEHREYWPLVNARAHPLGRERRILNHRLHQQYHALMEALAYQTQLDDDDMLSVTYYMLLQDRVSEAQQWFDRVRPRSTSTRMQYDYLAAYLDCFHSDPTQARSIVAKYKDYPVDHWRESFAAIGRILHELDGRPTETINQRDRDQQLAQLAASEPVFTLSLNGTRLTIDYKHLESVKVNYYLMDLELLFSRNPFVTEFAGQFSHIFPNQTETVELPSDKSVITIALPSDLHNKNVLIEVGAAGRNQSISYYSNSLSVTVIDSYGQLQVTDRETGRGLPVVYVKVYAQLNSGEVQFYKDGYTDLRGKFDYTSLSSNTLDQVRRFSILILSEDHGAIVREAKPPAQ